MQAKLTSILLGCFMLWVNIVWAQGNRPVYYFKNDGSVVNSIDSADYYRKVTMQSGEGFSYNEYFRNGTLHIIAHAKGTVTKPIFDGYLTAYYPNGKPSEMHEYKDGRGVKTFRYHQNGTMLQRIEFGPAGNLPYERLMYEADSAGKANIIDGNGTRRDTGTLTNGELTEKFDRRGPYLNGAKTGAWKGTDDKGFTFDEEYEEGRLKQGTTKTADGKTFTYTQAFTWPVFKTGRARFEDFIKHHLLNPADTINLKFEGKIHLLLAYTISQTGKVSAVKGYPNNSAGTVELKIKGTLPDWQPALLRGVPISCPMAYNYGHVFILATSPVKINTFHNLMIKKEQ